MSSDDLEGFFEPLLFAQSPQDYKYVTAFKMHNGSIINEQDVLEENRIDQSFNVVPIKVITEIGENYTDVYLEPSSETIIDTSDNIFLEEHNYAVRDENRSISNSELSLLQNDDNHKCKFCNKIFANITSLQRHLRSHTKEKPYQCKICDKRFSQQSNLWKHIRVHTGERPFECPECKRKFSQRANMKKHLMIHSGEKPFECPHCWRCFTQLANLNKHILLHIGTQPYKCKYCDKGFFQLSNMRKHEYVHEGIKPYTCSYCRVSYTQLSNLKKHLALHTNEKRNICEVCGKSFFRKDSLIKHQKCCIRDNFDSIESLLDLKTNKFVKIIQTDGSQQIFYVTDESMLSKLKNDIKPR